LRKEKGLSASELARRSNISQPYLSQLETGENNNPTTNLLEKLAKGLNIDYFDLLARTEKLSKEDAEYRKSIYEDSIKSKKELDELLEEYKEDLEEMKKDLFFLLTDYPDDIYYQKNTLTKDDKEKITKFIETFIMEGDD